MITVSIDIESPTTRDAVLESSLILNVLGGDAQVRSIEGNADDGTARVTIAATYESAEDMVSAITDGLGTDE